MSRILIALLLTGALSACSTTNVSLNYSASPTVSRAAINAQPVTVGTFLDQRNEKPNWLGVIRGGFGNHLKTLESNQPAVELVRTAFADGLRSRGVKTDAGSLQLGGTVRKLYCDQVARREANVIVELSVTGTEGQRLFTKTYEANRIEGSALAMNTGVLASPEELRLVLERALQEVVDKALDDPELRTALRI